MNVRSLRIPEQLEKALQLVEDEERIEEASAMRKLMVMGFDSYLSALYREGRLGLRDVARHLKIPLAEAMDRMAELGVGGNLGAADVLPALQRFDRAARGGVEALDAQPALATGTKSGTAISEPRETYGSGDAKAQGRAVPARRQRPRARR